MPADRPQSFTAGTPSLLRAINERTVLEFIAQHGPASRAHISRERGMSKPTVSQSLAALYEAGLVREAGRSSGGKGPTAQLYELNAEAGWVVGVDVGRSWIRAAIADLTGRVVVRRDERARARSASSLIEQVGALSHGLAKEAGLNWSGVTQATIGTPGVVAQAAGRVELAHNLPGWGKEGLIDALRKTLGTNTSFENDVNLAALGEQWEGLGKGVGNFVYVSVGTGIGMGLVLRGELFRGSSGAAGEVAYLPVGPTDPHTKSSRRRGAFESLAAADGIVAVARQHGMAPPLSPKKIFAAARAGNRTAQSVIHVEAERLALGLATIVPVLDPELVILGGGIGGNGDLLLEPVRNEFHAISPLRPRIEVSKLGDDSVLLGAVSTALAAARDRVFARSKDGDQVQAIG